MCVCRLGPGQLPQPPDQPLLQRRGGGRRAAGAAAARGLARGLQQHHRHLRPRQGRDNNHHSVHTNIQTIKYLVSFTAGFLLGRAGGAERLLRRLGQPPHGHKPHCRRGHALQVSTVVVTKFYIGIFSTRDIECRLHNNRI